jgi:hypothetical protein
MLKVKNTSNKIAGMGKTNIATISKTKAGMPKPASSMRATCCRIVDRIMVLMGESVVEESKKPTNAPQKRAHAGVKAISVPKSSDTPR